MQHPLQTLDLAVGVDDFDDDAFEDCDDRDSIMTVDTEPSVFTMTKNSHNSLDAYSSTLQIQPKQVPVRLIKRPDFPKTRTVNLVQEIFTDKPIYALASSPQGDYLAMGGDELRVYRLLSHTFSDMSTCAVFDKDSFVLFKPKQQGAVIDIAWTSKRPGIFYTAGMDKTAALWSVKTSDPLMLFPHPDVVSSLAVCPKDDRILVTGCIDRRLRVWSVAVRKVIGFVDLTHPITSVCFTPSGKSIVAGTASGHVHIYWLDLSDPLTANLKYFSQIHVRSSRGRNAAGTAKISGLQCVNGPNGDPLLLVTSNDSRIRLYRLRDKELKVKFHGILNEDSQLRASTHGDLVICPSEDGRVGVWKMPNLASDSSNVFLNIADSLRGRRLVDSLVSFRAAIGKTNEDDQFTEGQPLSSALFLPDTVLTFLSDANLRSRSSNFTKLIVTADMTGRIKVFEWADPQ